MPKTLIIQSDSTTETLVEKIPPQEEPGRQTSSTELELSFTNSHLDAEVRAGLFLPMQWTFMWGGPCADSEARIFVCYINNHIHSSLLHAMCQEIWKTQQWPQDWKRSVFIPIPKKGNAKEGSNYRTIALISVQFSSVVQSCPTLCDPMNCSMPGLPVHHQLLEFTQTHIHRVSDAIQHSSHTLVK